MLDSALDIVRFLDYYRVLFGLGTTDYGYNGVIHYDASAQERNQPSVRVHSLASGTSVRISG
jgi:hypothetical protein